MFTIANLFSFAVLLPAVTLFQDAYAQSKTLSGVVRAKGKKVFIRDASVIELPGRTNVVTTNAAGEFSIPLGLKSTGVLIRASSYEDLFINFEEGKLPEDTTFSLLPAPELVSSGVIRARKKTEVSQQSIKKDELDRVPGTGGDPVRSLQTLPSVVPSNQGSSEVIVRGSAPSDTKFFVDHLDVPFIYHFGGLGTVIPKGAIESVDLYAGGFSSVYSDAIGGIIQLRIENNIPDKLSGRFELGISEASAYLEGGAQNIFASSSSSSPSSTTESKPGEENKETTVAKKPSDKMGYRLGFRRTYLEVWAPVLKQAFGDALSFTLLPQATDYQIFLNGEHENGTWQGYLFGAADRASLDLSSNFSESETGRGGVSLFNYFQTSGLRYSLDLGSGWGLHLTPQQWYVLIDQSFFDNSVYITSKGLTLGASLEKRINKQFSLTFGLRPQIEWIRTFVDSLQFPAGAENDPFFDFDTATRSREDLRRTIYSGEFFVDATFKPNNDIVINPGIAYQQGQHKQQKEIDPRLNVRWAVNEIHALKAGLGIYSQKPEPQFDSQEYGNPELKLERATHYVAGWETKFNDDWSTDLQAYSKNMFQLVAPNIGEPEKKYDNSGKGRSRGFELFLKKNRTGRWFGWLSYGMGKSEKTDSSGNWKVSGYDRTHSANLVLSYKVTGQWDLGTRLQYISGQPFTPVRGGYFNQNTGRYLPDSTGVEPNSDRLPATFQMDIRSDKDFLFENWKLTWYVEVQNVTSNKNVVAFQYSDDYRTREEVYGLPVLPLTGIVGSF